jgi:hypothetical protein
MVLAPFRHLACTMRFVQLQKWSVWHTREERISPPWERQSSEWRRCLAARFSQRTVRTAYEVNSRSNMCLDDLALEAGLLFMAANRAVESR